MARDVAPWIEFGNWLAAAMRKKQISRGELADKVGVDATTISRWITGKNQPQTIHCHPLAEALGEDPGEVLTRAGHGRPAENVKPVKQLIDPLAVEIDRMLGPTSPLSDSERDRIRLLVDAQLAPYRDRMRRARRTG